MQTVVLFLVLLVSVRVPAKRSLKETCIQFNQLNSKIRDEALEKKDAKNKVHAILKELQSHFTRQKAITSDWSFPVSGYGCKAIGGKNGSGYIPKGYRFFDGNKHGGHPAHDIFISDKNQDSKDDNTKKRGIVNSILPGVVVAVEREWKINSLLRGGKYVMVFHPAEDLISYYAHLDSVLVETGQILKSGEALGEMGRTGLNAFKKRSPTHLHLMVLKVDPQAGLLPFNPYSKWKSCE